MISAIAVMFSIDPSTPSLNAATGMSSRSFLAWSTTQSLSIASKSSTPRVSWTVRAVTTERGWQPMLASVRRSACRPAPPVGSEAAKVSTIGGREGMEGKPIRGPHRMSHCGAGDSRIS